MELRQLEYFSATARLASVTKAAESLHVSQPSVTVSIRKLEAELEVQLLDRGQRRVALTPEGRSFLERADRILELARDAVAEMRDAEGPPRGLLRIGITPMMGAVLFPAALERFRSDHPGVEVALSEEGSIALARRLERGELDLGIMVTSDLAPGLDSRCVGLRPLVACLPPAHPLAALPAIPAGRLRDEPLILFQGDTYARKAVLAEFARAGFAPTVAFSSSQVGTMLGLVARGVGIAFLIEELAAGRGDVALRPLENPLCLSIGIAWKGARYLSRAAAAFVESFAAG